MSELGQSGPRRPDGGRPAPRAPPSVFHAGFILGPRINAGGRDRPLRPRARGCCPPTIPTRRRTLAAGARRAQRRAQGRSSRPDRRGGRHRRSSATANFDPDAPALVVAREGWHPGVIGIVASRLRERYRKPGGGDRPRSRRRHRQGLGPLAARRQPRPRHPGGLRRGPAAGRRRPRHGGGPDRAPVGVAGVPRLPLRAAGGARWPRRRRKTRWRSTPWSRPAPATRALARRVRARWRRSAPAIRNRCSPWPTCASSGPARCAAATCAATSSTPAARRLKAVAWRDRRHRARPAPAGRRRSAACGRQAQGRRLERPRRASSWRSRTSPIRRMRRLKPLAPARRLARPRRGGYIPPLPRQRALRLSVRTSDFQSGKRGSTPLGTASAARLCGPSQSPIRHKCATNYRGLHPWISAPLTLRTPWRHH